MYEVNILNLFFAMFPGLRKFKFSVYDDDRFMFCSELVGIIYREFGIIPKNANPTDIVPSDFLVKDADNMVDCKKFHPLLIKWY